MIEAVRDWIASPEGIATIATVLVGALGTVQWWISHRHERRKRDVELFQWARDVVQCVRTAEAQCKSPGAERSEKLGELAGQASALVDIGRLFFENKNGLRPRALDEVVKAFRTIRLVSEGSVDPERAALVLHEASRAFVDLLRSEMGGSLRRSPTLAADAGQSLGWDFEAWFGRRQALELNMTKQHPSRQTSAGFIGQDELATMSYATLRARLASDFGLQLGPQDEGARMGEARRPG